MLQGIEQGSANHGGRPIPLRRSNQSGRPPQIDHRTRDPASLASTSLRTQGPVSEVSPLRGPVGQRQVGRPAFFPRNQVQERDMPWKDGC